MADGKDWSVTFKLPLNATIIDIKKCLDRETQRENPIIMQDLGAGQFLVEFKTKEEADEFINSSIDFEELHILCTPPQSQKINVSILCLPAYVHYAKVENALAEYGDVTNEIIRLKYKKDHPLAGLENGNWLVRIILCKPSIPNSLKIDGHWCRIIHNQQKRVCLNCHAVGHDRRKCPEITCRICNEKGHLSYDCPAEFHNVQPEDGNHAKDHHDNNADVDIAEVEQDLPTQQPPHTPETEANQPIQNQSSPAMEDEVSEETCRQESTDDAIEVEIEEQRSGTKRHHSSTDTDSETQRTTSQPKIKRTQIIPQGCPCHKNKNN